MTYSLNKRIILNFLASLVSLAIILALAVSWGLRPSNFGSDTLSYIKIFQLVGTNISQSLEPGFIEYIKFIKKFSNNPQIFLLITSVLTSVFIIMAASLMLPRKSIYNFVVLLSISPFYQSLSINVIRQGLALSIALLLFSITLKSNQYRLAIGILAIALVGALHLPTAIIIIPLFFFNFKKPLLIWALCVFISVFSNLYGPLVSSLIGERYEAYTTSTAGYQTGFRVQFVVFSLFPYIIKLFMPRHVMSERLENVLSRYAVINAFGLMFNFLPYFDRFLIGSWIIMPFIFAIAIDDMLKGKLTKRLLVKIISLYSVIIIGFAVVYLIGGGI